MLTFLGNGKTYLWHSEAQLCLAIAHLLYPSHVMRSRNSARAMHNNPTFSLIAKLCSFDKIIMQLDCSKIVHIDAV